MKTYKHIRPAFSHIKGVTLSGAGVMGRRGVEGPFAGLSSVANNFFPLRKRSLDTQSSAHPSPFDRLRAVLRDDTKVFLLHIVPSWNLWFLAGILFLFAFPFSAFAQQKAQFKGQLMSWANYRDGHDPYLWVGARYLPEFSYQIGKEDTSLFDVEVSANIVGNTGFPPFDTAFTSGNISPYRAWLRYSTQQLELRVGLQKINFGSATTLRPLMWFDQIDPRDPLQLTNGVWGALGRYYFLNNANIWVWALYGNENRKGFESTQTYKKHPEVGGRFQFPVQSGEFGISYHHRTANSEKLGIDSLRFARIPENRIGIDGKWDLVVGLWIEASYTQKQQNLSFLTNQTLVNAGTDYTFGLGNGLNVVLEQLVFAFDDKPFAFQNPRAFTAMTMSYPLGLFDNISSVLYYDWSSQSLFSFVNWQRSFNKFMLYTMAYWNPTDVQLPQQNGFTNPFSNKGVQVMVVFNH